MNSNERFSKITSLRKVFESTAIEEVSKKIWNVGGELKFSDKYKMNKLSERASKDMLTLSEMSDNDIDALHNVLVGAPKKRRFFENRNKVAEFLSSIATNYIIDVRKINESVVDEINNAAEIIKSGHPNYNPHDELTWGSNREIADMYHQLYGEIAIDNKMILEEKYIQLSNIKKIAIMESVEVKEGKKDLYKMIYDILDENSIILLYSYIFGHIVDYSDKIRDKVYDYLLKNPESPAVDMVTGSISDTELNSLMRNFNFIDAQSFMLGTSFLAFMKNNDNKLCRVRFIDNNKFGIKELQ